MTIVFALVGLPFAVIGFYFLIDTYRFNQAAQAVDGEVYDNIIKHGKDSDGNPSISIYPVINFFFAGSYYRFQADISDGQERDIGSAVTVLIKDNDPFTARFKSSARYFMGGIFSFLGILFTVIGIHETHLSDFTFFSYLAQFGALGFIFSAFFVAPFIIIPYKLYQFKQKLNQAGMHSFRDIKIQQSEEQRVKKLDAAELYQQPAAHNEDTVTAPQSKITAKNSKRLIWLFTLLGFCMLAGGLYVSYNTYTFISVAKSGTGMLVDYKENYDSSKNSRTYCPVFTFTHPATGRSERLTDKLCSSNRKYNIGENIPVLYSSTNNLEVQIDSGWMNYFGGGILFILGAAFSFFGLRGIRSAGK